MIINLIGYIRAYLSHNSDYVVKEERVKMKNRGEGLNFILSLPDERKSKLFDKIAENYYNTNFGSFSKSQMDLLMFSIYIEELIDNDQCFDDYTMSKQLGILQTNVRQLKKKKQLIYPKNYKWYEAFLSYSKTATTDHLGRIVISIQDPNVYLELQHAIEEIGGYVEVQLNSKLLKIPPGYYIELLLKIHQIESGADKKAEKEFRSAFIKKLNEKYLEEQKIVGEITEKTLLTKLKEQSLEIVIDVLKDMIPGGSVIIKGIESISKALFEK